MDRRSALKLGAVAALSCVFSPLYGREQETSESIALVGDSILDNAPHVAGSRWLQPQVSELLAASMSRWKLLFLAKSGASFVDVRKQLEQIQSENPVIVLSTGGNDAGRAGSLLAASTNSVGSALAKVHRSADEFEASLVRTTDAARAKSRRLSLLTLPDPRPSKSSKRAAIAAATAVFNDRILRVSSRYDIPVLDLRTLLSESEDYADVFHPSPKGSMKIAHRIMALLQANDYRECRLY